MTPQEVFKIVAELKRIQEGKKGRPVDLVLRLLRTIDSDPEVLAFVNGLRSRGSVQRSWGDNDRSFWAHLYPTPRVAGEKYSWRPGTGVRSTCEVFLHIAGANYLFADMMGAKAPASVDTKNIEKCPASKDAVMATMKASFTHIKAAVAAIPDKDADKAINVFGDQTTMRGLLTSVAEHGGEHLGQSIAYARTNGIVPPWSK